MTAPTGLFETAAHQVELACDLCDVDDADAEAPRSIGAGPGGLGGQAIPL